MRDVRLFVPPFHLILHTTIGPVIYALTANANQRVYKIELVFFCKSVGSIVFSFNVRIAWLLGKNAFWVRFCSNILQHQNLHCAAVAMQTVLHRLSGIPNGWRIFGTLRRSLRVHGGNSCLTPVLSLFLWSRSKHRKCSFHSRAWSFVLWLVESFVHSFRFILMFAEFFWCWWFHRNGIIIEFGFDPISIANQWIKLFFLFDNLCAYRQLL